MKKIVIGIIVIGLAALAIDKIFFSKKEEVAEAPKEKALTISKNSAAFNASFERLLNSYYSLKQALIEYDTARVNITATTMGREADSLLTAEIKGDTTGMVQKTAEDLAGTISGSAKGIVGETDLVKKKREFNLVSDALYNLIRTVRYDGQKIYHQHCPMAFNEDEEAFWISNSNVIENPYLGKHHPKYHAAMLNCGDIVDSLDFAKP